MKLALLIGNRFNPWHFEGYRRLRGAPEITVFRAESEIQDRFDACNDRPFEAAFERIDYDTQAGDISTRWKGIFETRVLGREPRILPFHERLEGFDVVQSWELFTDWSAEAAEARKKYNVPFAAMVWDNIPFNMENTEQRQVVKRNVIEHADRFIVHSQRSRHMLWQEGVPDNRIAFVRPGVDTKVFSPGEGRREAFGIDDEDFVILFVGWLLPRKGIDFLLLAVRELVQRGVAGNRPVRLLMVGSDLGRDRVDPLIDRLGLRDICRFTGPIPYGRMVDAYRSSDCFVLPSIATPEWQEQFGMSLIEAMACGIPVISTYSGAIPEVVEDGGILCPPNDFVSLADALRGLVEDDARRTALAQAGRDRAERLFELDRFAAEMSAVYEGLARRT